MTNTYDILVNYKKEAYEFFEWDKEDGVKHIKKIPTFKVSKQTLIDFLNNDVVVDNDFLNLIKQKTELFLVKGSNIIEYSCVIFCDEECASFMFDEKGVIKGRSKLLFDEADEIIFKGADTSEYKINYNVISSIEKKKYFTRKEKKLIDVLLNYLDNAYFKKSKDEIKYIFFECFNYYIEDDEKTYSKLKESIVNGNFKVIEKIKDVIKVLKK